MPELSLYDDAVVHYASSERFERVSVSVEVDGNPRFSPDEITDDIASYMSQFNIQYVPRDDDQISGAAHLDLKFVRNGQLYSIDSMLTAADGRLVENVTLYHDAGNSDTKATQQQLASLVIDDLLLIWHPLSTIEWTARGKDGISPFALATNELQPQSESGNTRLTWETFPSDRVLKGSGLDESVFSRVRYELRVHKDKRPDYLLKPDIVYRVGGILEPKFDLPFLLPSCEYIRWSVRAHFKLRGHPRVTEWSGTFYTSPSAWKFRKVVHAQMPPHIYRRPVGLDTWQPAFGPMPLQHHALGGVDSEIAPPFAIRCKDLMRGFFEYRDKPDNADFKNQIKPLQPGESIGALAVVEKICLTDQCHYDEETTDGTGELLACLQNEFKRRSLDVLVENFSDEMRLLPHPPDNDLLSHDSWLAALQNPENQRSLQSSGFRYVLATAYVLQEVGDADHYESVSATIARQYSVRVNTKVFDTKKGEVVGTIRADHFGKKGKSYGLFGLMPYYIPFGSISDFQSTACGEMARRASFIFRGGVSTGWPDEYFRSVYEPIWSSN